MLGFDTIELITGGVVSTTVTFDEQLLELLDPSVAMQVKGSEPSGNVDPSPGVHPCDAIPQLSDTLSISFATTAPAGLLHSSFGVRQLMVGFSVSLTVTLNSQASDRGPAALCA